MPAYVGCLVPLSPWTGRLVGATGKALSILHPDGALVSVVGEPGRMEARALVPAGGWDGFRRSAEGLLDGGAGRVPASWDGASLRLEGDEGADAVLPLDGAETWDPRPGLLGAAGMIPASERREAVVRIGRLVRATLERARAAGRSSEGIHADGPFAEGFRRLSRSPGFPVNLVGFGPGTTPAGDDWLSGYLTAADLIAGGPGKGAPSVRAGVRESLTRTGAAGRALLEGALESAPPAYLVELALAAADRGAGAPGRLERAVDGALGHGATSGEDALAGFMAGLET